ncbi:MAG: NOB1 family endonuclease [Methanobacteriota archaeon]
MKPRMEGGMEGKRPLVLDTSALLSGKTIPANGVMYTSPRILDEFQHGGRSRRTLDYLLEAGLRVDVPKKESLSKVEEAAHKTGDSGRLSEADVELLALAVDVKGTLVTDDYSIQNVAATLSLPFETIAQQGIQQIFTWEYRCAGCGRKYEAIVKECSVCGSPIKTVKAK